MLQVIFTDTWNYNYFTGFSSHSDKIHNKMTGVWCGNKDTEELNLWAEVVLCVIDQSIDHIKAQEDMSGSIHDSLTTHHRTQRYNQALAHRHSGQQVVTLVNYSLTSFTESHQYYILSYDLCWCQLEITCPQWICSGPHVSLHAEQLQNWNTRLFHSSSKRLITLNMREHLRLQRSLEEEDITGATKCREWSSGSLARACLHKITCRGHWQDGCHVSRSVCVLQM